MLRLILVAAFLQCTISQQYQQKVAPGVPPQNYQQPPPPPPPQQQPPPPPPQQQQPQPPLPPQQQQDPPIEPPPQQQPPPIRPPPQQQPPPIQAPPQQQPLPPQPPQQQPPSPPPPQQQQPPPPTEPTQQQPPPQQQYQPPPPPQQQYQQPPQQQYQQQVPVQQQQVPVQQQQVPIQQQQVPIQQQQQGHAHTGDPQLLNPANIAQERDHIQEHMEVPIDTSKMSEQELQFHYFKMHDADNNNKLDGCELIKSLIHWHEQGHKQQPQPGSPPVGEKIFNDDELINLIDPILNMDDHNRDGYIDYPEFVRAQQKSQKQN